LRTSAALNKFLLIIAAITFTQFAFGQSKADIANTAKPIAWLGVDFTQANFIGTPYQNQNKQIGEVTEEDFRDKYVPAWNELFIDEKKKYNVAEALNRAEVKYAYDVVAAANAATKYEPFTKDVKKYKKLTEARLKELVAAYDFKDEKGIGLLFFVDGMDPEKEEAGAWVTFVDMGSKKLLLTNYVTGKPGGAGFRNYWSKTFNDILKTTKLKYKDW
jgi:hypothetical protein